MAIPEQPKKVTGGAFGRFLAENRPALIQECSGKPATAVVKLASERFKALDEAGRAEYQEKYKQAQEQYEKDMAAFLEAGGEKKAIKRKGDGDDKAAKKQKRDPERPKKPVGGAYGCFLDKNREAFQKECEGKPSTAVAKLGGERWKELGEAEKQPYEAEYAAKKTAYDEAMKSYVPPAAEPEGADEDTEEKGSKPSSKAEKKSAAAAAKAEKKEAAAVAKAEKKEAAAAAKAGKKSTAAAAKAEKKTAAKAKKAGKVAAGAAKKVPMKVLTKRVSKMATAKGKKGKGPAQPELEAAVAAKAEKAGLTANLLKLLSRQDIIDSGKSQAQTFKALEASGGLIHPAKRALLGA